MNKFLFILIFLSLQSCLVTEKQRKKICNSCPSKIELHDSIIEKIVEVPVQLPPIQGPTVYLPNPCQQLCDSLGNLKPFEKTVKKNGINTTIKTEGNNLVIESTTDTLKGKAYVKQKETFSKESKTIKEYVNCENERTSFDGFCRWYFYGTFSVLILFLLIRYRKLLFNLISFK